MLHPKSPVPLFKHVHRNAKQTYNHLDARKYSKHLLDTSTENPRIRKICQNEAEYILEDDQVREDLYIDVSMRVKKVLCGTNSAHDHGGYDEHKEDIGNQPTVLMGIVCGDAEAVQSYTGEDQSWQC